MRLWAEEQGTLWALKTVDGLPPAQPAQVETAFREVGQADFSRLAAAMNLPSPEPSAQRLQGNRRCFALWAAGEIVTYGWVTLGREVVGELERTFHLPDDEAYVWDCATIPAWRGRGCYSHLLSRIIYRLGEEAVPCIWIGASRQNRPSIRGFANAGFEPVLDLIYRRLLRLTWMRLEPAPAAAPGLTAAAFRILQDEHERRLGSLIIGVK